MEAIKGSLRTPIVLIIREQQILGIQKGRNKDIVSLRLIEVNYFILKISNVIFKSKTLLEVVCIYECSFTSVIVTVRTMFLGR